SKEVENFREWESEKQKQKNNSKAERSNDPNLFQQKKELKKDIRQLKNKVSNLESAIAEMEAIQQKQQDQLKDPKVYSDPNNQLLQQFEESSKMLNDKMKQWEQALQELENKENELSAVEA